MRLVCAMGFRNPLSTLCTVELDKKGVLKYYVLGEVQLAGGLILANTTSAKRHLRVSVKRKRRNRLVYSRANTFVKKTNRLIEAGELDQARTMAIRATSALDRAAEKGIIHKNTAARRKSRLMKRLNRTHSVGDRE